MHIPEAFLETDSGKLAALVRERSFGELVTVNEGQPYVSHLPFLFDPTESSQGVLYAHVSRSNPHWKQGESDALAIFHGPHHYISPTYYAQEGTVPTWNYVAVHMRGTVEWLDQESARREVLQRLVAFHEGERAAPWVGDFEAPFMIEEMRGVVPLRIVVRSIEGKWKLNQHHPLEVQERTAQALRRLASEDAQAVAALMEENIAARRRAGGSRG